MILIINQKESATLNLHMAIMRKKYRQLFKRDYKARRDELNQSYDYILDMSKDAIESQNKANEVHMDTIDLEVLCAFLYSYVCKLSNVKLTDDWLEHVEIMQDLHLRCQTLMTV